MSLYAATEGNYAEVTGLTLPSTSSFSACGFWFQTVANTDYQVPLSVENASGTGRLSVTPVSSGQQATLFVQSTGSNYNTQEDFIVGRWHFVAFGQNGGDLWFGMTPYFRRHLRTVTQGSIATFTPEIIRVGGFGGSSSFHAPGYFAGMKYWSRFRSPQDIEQEMVSVFPVDRRSLGAAWPLTQATGLRDVSGRGRHLSLVGTPVIGGIEPSLRASRRRYFAGLPRVIKSATITDAGPQQGRIVIASSDWANVSQWPWTPRVRVTSL